jgi:hypothetical protein
VRSIIEHNTETRGGSVWVMLPEPRNGAFAHRPRSIDCTVIATDHTVYWKRILRK